MQNASGSATQGWRRIALRISFVLLAITPGPVTIAEEATPAPTAVAAVEPALEIFSAARLLNPSPPAYPGMARLRAREGWVLLNCVLDANGALTDVTVNDSSGQPEFETAAVNWMRGNRFEPARLGAQTVETSFPYKVTFMLEDEVRGARSAFVRSFRRFQDAIAAKDRAAADAELAEFDVVNLYEDAYFHMARYWHATLWGSDAERIAALKAALANERHARFLPESTFNAAARALFGLQLRQSDFGAALATYSFLPPSTQAEPAVASAAANLRALATDTRAFRVQGEIDARGFWSTRLLKRRFRIEPGTGTVSEFHLRCERRHVIVKLDPELEYTRGATAGECEIAVLGTRGSTFSLVQL